MIKRFYQCSTILFFVGFSFSFAQDKSLPPAADISPPIDPVPLVRQIPLTSIQTKDVRKLLKAISDSVSQNGFTITQYDSKECSLEAIRPKNPAGTGQDKILVWLERDIQFPENNIRIYLQYGHYKEILAGRSGAYRIKISAAEEEKRIGKLKQSIVSISMTN